MICCRATSASTTLATAGGVKASSIGLVGPRALAARVECRATVRLGYAPADLLKLYIDDRCEQSTNTGSYSMSSSRAGATSRPPTGGGASC